MIANLTAINREKYIIEHLTIKLTEKELHGEVFTHPDLIYKIFEKIPDNIFTNHTFKWFDPTAGIGNFMIILYTLLMDGLKYWEPNEHIRSNHIINNMIFMNELNPINCQYIKDFFGNNVNLTCKDFLEYNNCKYDCIIGNPPFQHYYGKTNSGSRILGGKNKLYEQIFLKSYELLNNNGYISFIVPDAIFSGNNNKSYNILLKNHISFVSFHSSNLKYFKKIQQPICYFIMNKTSPCETYVENDDEIFKTYLQDRIINPIKKWNKYTDELTNKYISNKRNNVIYNRGKNINSYNGSKFTLIYTPNKFLYTDDIALAKGYNIKKAVVFAISPELKFKMDWDGDFGVGPNTFYIPFINDFEGKQIEQMLNSDEYKILALATKNTRQYLKIAFIEHIIIGQW